MSYYSSGSENGWVSTIIAIILALAIMLGFKTCSVSNWNYGICQDCQVRYELVDVSRRHLKYYTCPECGKEVTRY